MTRRTLPLLAVFVFGACATTGRPAAIEALASDSHHTSALLRFTVPDTLDAWIEREMERRRIPGLTLGIARAGEVLVARAYGVADVQNQVPVNPSTRFDLASLTKAFTAAGILLLVEDGLLDLDAPISTYLMDAPQNWAGVTSRHLLNHTSGLPVTGTGFSGRATPWPLIMSTQAMYDAARGDTLSFRPGEMHVYSDVGYFLLGVMTERVSGTRWRDFIRERIFEPVGMRDSYVLDLERVHRNEARGYTIRNGEIANSRRVHQFETPSDVGIFSNVLDMAKWDAALYSDQFLSEASRSLLWTQARLTDGRRFPYGAGWQLWCRGGHPGHQHHGGTGTQIVRLPSDTLVVIVLTNLGYLGGGQFPEVNSLGLAPRIAEMMVPSLAAPALRWLSEAEREQFTGTYSYVSGDIPPSVPRQARIFVEGGELVLQDWFGRYPLRDIGNGVLALHGVPAVIVPERNPAGRVEAWRLHSMYPLPASDAVRDRGDCAVEPGVVGALDARAERVEDEAVSNEANR